MHSCGFDCPHAIHFSNVPPSSFRDSLSLSLSLSLSNIPDSLPSFGDGLRMRLVGCGESHHN